MSPRSVALCLTTLFHAVLAISVNAQKTVDPPTPLPINEKAVYVQSSLGPFGEAYIPPEVLAQKDFFRFMNDGKIQLASDNFFFPSIYFTISAKPYIELRGNRDRQGKGKFPDYEFTKKGENLNWMRVTITILPITCSCQSDGCVETLKGDDQDQYVKVLSIAPEETTSSSKENPLSTIGTVGDALVNKLLPFVYAEEHPTTQNASGEYSAASGAVSILFKNLFPPKTVANNYAFIDGDVHPYSNKNTAAPAGKQCDADQTAVTPGEKDCVNYADKFGWYWTRNDDPEKAKSILGVRRSVAFLQVRRGVRGIKVRYRIEAKWDSDYSKKIDDEYVDVSNIDQVFEFDQSNCFLPSKQKPFYERTDYEMLPDLEGFPMVIPKEFACRIFQKDTSEPNLQSSDIPDVEKVVTQFNGAAAGSLTKLIWDAISLKVANRYEVDGVAINRVNSIADIVTKRGARVAAKKPGDDQALKKILADEITRLYAEEKFFDDFLTLASTSEEVKLTLKHWKLYGQSRKIAGVFRKAIESEFAGLFRPLKSPSDCDAWFVGNPFPASDVETLANSWNLTLSTGGRFTLADDRIFVHREAVKKRLDIPLLKDGPLQKIKIVP